MTGPKARQMRVVYPGMLAAYADLKAGPLERRHHHFIGPSGRKHDPGAIKALARRYLAKVWEPKPGHARVRLTRLGRALRPEGC